MKGKLILIVGPSGSGKATLLRHVRKVFPHLVYVPSFSTRDMRPGESEGNPYRFLSSAEFKEKINDGDFIEWAEYAGNFYGTDKDSIVELLKEGKVVIKEIEVQGARILLDTLPRENMLIIFVTVGDWSILEERIVGRAPIDQEELEKRKERFDDEMSFMSEADHVVRNEEGMLERSKKEIQEIIEKVFSE